MLVASQGFEPQYAESESAVLPLNDEATGESLARTVVAAERLTEPARPSIIPFCRAAIKNGRLSSPYKFSTLRLLPTLQNRV